MKKITCLLLTVVITGLASSCKKGEGDPFLSLRSRKARIAGEWTVSAATIDEVVADDVSSTIRTTTYDGAQLTTVTQETYNNNTTTTTEVTAFTQKYTFEKDGTYSRVDTYEEGTTTNSGTWSFVGKSKENDLKKKEAIFLTETNVSGYGMSTAYTGFDGAVFVIEELKNKEMIFTVAFSISDGVGSNTTDVRLTLTQN